MSIYPVVLSEWFPPGDENHQTAFSIVKSVRCLSCGGRARWKKAIGSHSLPFGHGDLWCSVRCLDSGKIAKPDKRRDRRMRRRYKESDKLMDILLGDIA